MTGRADFTGDEWRVLIEAPNAAAMAVVLTDLAGWEYIEEVAAIFRFIREAGTRYPDNVLVQEVIADLLAPSTQAHSHDDAEVSRRPVAQRVASQISRLTAAVAVLEAKGGADTAGFKQFLHDLAAHVAAAASEEPLGKGPKVSPKEKAFLTHLESILKL